VRVRVSASPAAGSGSLAPVKKCVRVCNYPPGDPSAFQAEVAQADLKETQESHRRPRCI
jgi:hypothetical protein